MSRTLKIPSIFEAIDKITAPMRKMEKSVHSFANNAQMQVDRVERKFRNLIPSISSTGKQMISLAKTAIVTAGIIGGISFSVQQIRAYDDALKSAQAITGTSNKEFAEFRKQIEATAKATKKSTVDVAKGFEIVGSAQPELLKNADALGKVTKAAIILDRASGDGLESSAKSLTSVMNQFSKEAEDAEKVMNVLAAGSVVGSANITNVAESMKTFGAVAAGANISVEQSVALVEVLGKFSLFGAEAGTKLRGSVLRLQQANIGYASGQFNINDALLEAQKKMNSYGSEAKKDAFLIKLFGAENISAGKTLLNNIDLFNQYTKGVTGTTIAQDQANLKSSSLNMRLQMLTATWTNLITTTDVSSSALNIVNGIIDYVTKNMGTLVKILTIGVLVFVALKAILLVVKAGLIAYNVVMGISAALNGTLTLSVAKNTVALGAYRAIVGVVTAAQWLWNAAMNANPIGIIITLIAALIGTITAVVVKYESWGAALTLVMGPLGFIISLIEAFRRNWDMITEAFKTGGFKAGLIAIGKTILDAVLMPLQQVMKIIANFTGFEWAENAANNINAFRTQLGVDVGDQDSDNSDTPAVNPEVSRQEALRETIIKENQNVSININDGTGRASVESDNDVIPISLTPTFSY